ncbi:MAG: NUDIX hydrolase [Anaerolineae bacterium]|jgi:8-oxo-dGTP diphosphatase
MSLPDHRHPALTVDIVLFAAGRDDLRVLLVKRDHPPFADAWAFPGGFVNNGESPDRAAYRELEEETSIQDIHLHQLRVFGDPRRDPRGHVVTLAYLAVAPADALHWAQPGSDAAQARWWPVSDLPSLAFDHADILECALRRLRRIMACSHSDLDILPGRLTLRDLQGVCERVKDSIQKRTG